MNRRDILQEVSELCQESLDFIHSQLIYYRASVYKQESADVIQKEIDTLRSISSLLPHNPMEESIRDYEAETHSGQETNFPGECLFSARVVRLLERLRSGLSATGNQCLTGFESGPGQNALAEQFKKNKQEILLRVRPGSRAWSFFRSF